MKKRTVLLAGLAAAMMMAVPALAEDAVIDETIKLVTVNEDNAETITADITKDTYTWVASTRTLTLKDGFKMSVDNSQGYDDNVKAGKGIIIPTGTTIVVEGTADIMSIDDCIFVHGTLSEEVRDAVTVFLKKDAVLTLDSEENGFDTWSIHYIVNENGEITESTSLYFNLAFIGEDKVSSKLIIEADKEEGIFNSLDIVIKECTVDILSKEEEGIYAENDITIDNSTLNIISEDEEGIYSSMGFITIDNSKIKIVCEEECIDAAAGITITNTSLDLTSTDGDGVLDVDSDSDLGITLEYAYANNIHLDSQFVLYGENGKRLTNTPIAYSADLITIEYYDDESYYEYWAYNGTPVYRLVTAADTSIYIEKTLGSLKTVSFSGDGAEALDGLVRAFGSTINLTKIVPAAREGYTFTGWYADPACTKPITKLVVTGNMEIYAGWELIPVEEEETAEETAVEAAAE